MQMTAKSYRFTHAVVRKPASSITDGLRFEDTGTPSHALFRGHHASYVDVLRSTGAKVTVLDPLEAYPDSVFVEDAALCLQEGVVQMRPGAPSRLGEAQEIAGSLAEIYGEIHMLEEGGFIEGGDILVAESEILVGLSTRTDSKGVAALQNIVGEWGYKVREFQTPEGVLHFKTDCSLLDEETILSTKRLAASDCFDGYRVIHVAEGEEACANSIRFNDVVIMPDGFPKTTEILLAAGYDLRLIGNSEAAKVDGGMSCLSLRFSPNPS